MTFFRKLRWLRRRSSKEAELQQELQFHLEEEAGDLQSRGLASEEARYAAKRDLGNPALIQEDTRAAWTWTWCEQLLQDLRYALRTMAANKSFTLLAILSLALGIGANTAIFSFMDSILLRSLPVPDPQSLVMLSWHTPREETHGTDMHDDSLSIRRAVSSADSFPIPHLSCSKRATRYSPVFSDIRAPAGSIWPTAAKPISRIRSMYRRTIFAVSERNRLLDA